MAEHRGTDALLERPIWSDDDIADAGVPAERVGLVTVGGGMGSFALCDLLRQCGVSTRRVAVVTRLERPHTTYRYLARASQIPDDERIRSDSGSTMDNIHGWPGYALREAAAAPTWRQRVAPVWQVLTEPVLSDFYTPRARQVYASIDREAARIGWQRMVRNGQARCVRRRAGGGYFTLVNTDEGRRVIQSEHVHLAVGYPGLRFLPDLQDFVNRHGDLGVIVNAYAQHDQVYERALASNGTIVVRGSGIVAVRVVLRMLADIRRTGSSAKVIHLFRTFVDGPQGESRLFRRPGRNGFAYQGFNFPKSAWGGQLKARLEKATPEERVGLVNAYGGTNIPYRRGWEAEFEEARRSGAYRTEVGEVVEIERAGARLALGVRRDDGAVTRFETDFIIDGTGLEADITEHRLLADLLEHGGASRNLRGRLAVEDTFEVSGTRSGEGRMYASGSATLGGSYAGVDSFLGLQFVALRVADDLARLGWAPRFGTRRSVAGFWRWATNRPEPEGR